MLDELTAAVVQFAPAGPPGVDANLRLIVDHIRTAATRGARLVVFPELALSGFPVDGVSVTEDARSSPRLAEIAAASVAAGCYTVVGFAERHPGALPYNSAALLGPDGLIGITRKHHLPGRERGWFSAGEPPATWHTPVGGIGVVICYDAWFPELVKTLAVQGAEIIVVINSIWGGGRSGGIGDADTKARYWRMVPTARALDTQSYVLACNGIGTHDFGAGSGRWRRLGRSRIVDPRGVTLAVGAADDATVLTAVLTATAVIRARSGLRLLADSLPAVSAPVATRPPTTIQPRHDTNPRPQGTF